MRCLPIILAASVAAGSASAQSLAFAERKPLDVRAFAGFLSGVGVDGWLAERRLRVDLEADTTLAWPAFGAGAVAMVLPLSGGARTFFGLRAGYQLEYSGYESSDWHGSHWAHAPDAGAVVHFESAAGSVFEAALGPEAVIRADAVHCCDSAGLATLSFGVRAALRGELALSPTWALFAQVGLRTADHLLEIKVLPAASLGVRIRPS